MEQIPVELDPLRELLLGGATDPLDDVVVIALVAIGKVSNHVQIGLPIFQANLERGGNFESVAVGIDTRPNFEQVPLPGRRPMVEDRNDQRPRFHQLDGDLPSVIWTYRVMCQFLLLCFQSLFSASSILLSRSAFPWPAFQPALALS